MRNRTIIEYFVLAFLFAVLSAQAEDGVVAKTPALRLATSVVEQAVTHRVMPQYPADSSRLGHTGVVVVDITVSSKTGQADCKVLQTPDANIALSTVTALKQWRFKPFILDGSAVNFSSRLIFYFLIKNGKPNVVDPVPLSASSD